MKQAAAAAAAAAAVSAAAAMAAAVAAAAATLLAAIVVMLAGQQLKARWPLFASASGTAKLRLVTRSALPRQISPPQKAK